MSSTLIVYTIKWKGPYKEGDLPKDRNNMIYLWTGKTGPHSKKNQPCYCGVTGRGVQKRSRDKNHKKDCILKGTRRCWIGIISGGKRKVSTGYKNTAFEKSEYLVVHYLRKYKRCCVLNERKTKSPDVPVGVFNIFFKQNGEERCRRPNDILSLPRVILWNGEKMVTDGKKEV